MPSNNSGVSEEKRTWWKEAVVYQIYPRSFFDSNGDGIGDLPGITQKLDYIKFLGADAIWLCPCYASPNEDNGYDISDYQAIMEEFGTLEDFETLLQEAHNRNIRVIMDLVLNHTSSQHPWFQEAKKSRDNPYHDYYIWKEKQGNWQSHFGGPAWSYNPETEEYYLHLFTPGQPDLNWENPSVREEIYKIVDFWVEKGVDGFRLDTVNMYSKTPGLPDLDMPRLATEHFLNGPKIHQYLHELYTRCFKDKGLVTVGEAPGVTPEGAKSYVAPQREELDMIFPFEHMEVDTAEDKWAQVEYLPEKLKKVLTAWQYALEGVGWNSLYFENHDQPRSISRFGDEGKYWKQSAKMLAMLLLTLKGTPFVYQGEELGMTNVPFGPKDYRDVEVLHTLKTRPNTKELFAGIAKKSRDNARTPMQWEDGPNAGFSSQKPWIIVNPNYPEINAKKQQAEPDAIWKFYQKLIAFRKQHPTLVYGRFEALDLEHPNVFSYTRTGEEKFFIFLNLTGRTAGADLPDGERVLSNYEEEGAAGKLRPYEAVLIRKK